MAGQKQLIRVLAIGTSSVTYIHIYHLEVGYQACGDLAFGAGRDARGVTEGTTRVTLLASTSRRIDVVIVGTSGQTATVNQVVVVPYIT